LVLVKLLSQDTITIPVPKNVRNFYMVVAKATQTTLKVPKYARKFVKKVRFIANCNV